MAEALAGTLLEQGIEQGEARAKRNAILKLLQSRFSDVPETLTTRINTIHSNALLDKLFDEVLAAENLDDIHL